ncbi:MAG: DNRLRE domain-containing protein [Anaerolineae bacterium]|nr:DNRLRE domain-containing protein [Anaerolineae bacterium]
MLAANSRLWYVVLPVAALLLSAMPAQGGISAVTPTTEPGTLVTQAGTRIVNAPYDVPGEQAAILWFGRVTPTLNAVDARVSYKPNYLYVRVASIDRRLWYDKSPSADDLVNWDAVSLYLRTTGNGGSTPDASSFRLDAQLTGWTRTDEDEATYRGDGTGWSPVSIPMTTTAEWRGSAPNDELDDRAWVVTYRIPYKSLGIDGPPAARTVWGMALIAHDRDEAEGPPATAQRWPEMMDPAEPATWGQLHFGLPAYEPSRGATKGSVTIRHGLDGAVVADADVGGSSVCGDPAMPDYFSTWGGLNWAGKIFVNIQNLGDTGDWPCFSRTYITFPLDRVPPGQQIVSATLTLYLTGGAGQHSNPGPERSLIQVLTVDEGWEESALTWNNAPLAKENVAATWVDPVLSVPPTPGIAYHWDVSRAVAQAYAASTSLHLALYESDWAYHSGKYFHSSDVGDWNATGRPTLTVTWGSADDVVTIYVPLVMRGD